MEKKDPDEEEQRSARSNKSSRVMKSQISNQEEDLHPYILKEGKKYESLDI